MTKNPSQTTESPISKDESVYRDIILGEITEDFDSPDFMDRRLIGIKRDGQSEILIPSVKVFMGWEKIPGESTYYPFKVSFSPEYNKFFFVKYLGGTGHSSGLYSLDIKTRAVQKLDKMGEEYEDYLNGINKVSPDGTKVARYSSNLYLLNLLQDDVRVIAEPKQGEIFFVAQEITDFKWLDNGTVQYPVYSSSNFDTPKTIRQIKVN